MLDAPSAVLRGTASASSRPFRVSEVALTVTAEPEGQRRSCLRGGPRARLTTHNLMFSRRLSAAASLWASEVGVVGCTPPVLVRRSAVACHFARTVSFSGEMQAAMQSTLLGRQSSLTLCSAGTVNGGGLRGTATGEEDGGAIT